MAVRSQQGQAFLEVLVATVILTLAITPFITVYVQTTRGTAQSGSREGAVEVTRGVLERVLAGTNPASPQTSGIYTVTWSKTAVSGRSGLSRLVVTATWSERSGTQSYVLTTYTRR